ncbi:unnamed protein product [Lactuca saligna]|uniref:Uncharacterized protein n=1 Tax=Lactuca saligna TaxID=75948 RepID=A0AA35Z2Q6_LACSI|nr:unnamed protein product [Lactuca saligna]
MLEKQTGPKSFYKVLKNLVAPPKYTARPLRTLSTKESILYKSGGGGGAALRQQPNHGHTTAFANIYHPPQLVITGAVDPLAGGGPGSPDMVGPATTASVYQQQQPQPTQVNWPNNY